MFPGNPNIRVERKDLQEIKFPLAFKLCVDPDNNDSIVNYRKFGYQSSYDFFRGESMFNESLRGWNGHTSNHSILGTVKGFIDNIIHYTTKIFLSFRNNFESLF